MENRWHTIVGHVDWPRIDEFEAPATIALGICEHLVYIGFINAPVVQVGIQLLPFRINDSIKRVQHVPGSPLPDCDIRLEGEEGPLILLDERPFRALANDDVRLLRLLQLFPVAHVVLK